MNIVEDFNGDFVLSPSTKSSGSNASTDGIIEIIVIDDNSNIWKYRIDCLHKSM